MNHDHLLEVKKNEIKRIRTKMSTKTVNISFDDGFLAEIDAEAKKESRSRSELLREAVRQYVERQQRWEKLFQFGDIVRDSQGLSEKDVGAEIAKVRARKDETQ